MRTHFFTDFGSERGYFYDWDPSPEQVEKEFFQLAQYYDDVAVPMSAALQIAKEGTRRMFRNEVDKQGDPWWPLDPDYLQWKIDQGKMEEILHKEGDLSEQAPEAWHMGPDTLWFNIGEIPWYGPLHETGRGDEADIGFAAQHRQAVRERRSGNPEFADWKGSKKQDLGIGTGRALPARPFIGLDQRAEAEIISVFEEWFYAPVEEPTGGSGPVRGMWRKGQWFPIDEWTQSIEYRSPAFGGGFSVRGAGGRFVGVYKD